MLEEDGYKTQLLLYIGGSVVLTFITIDYFDIPADSAWVLAILPAYAVVLWLIFHYLIDFISQLITNLIR